MTAPPTSLMQPKLLTTLKTYSLAELRADALAGLTMAIVALPLSTRGWSRRLSPDS